MNNLGFLVWVKTRSKDEIRRIIRELQRHRITSIRTGVSWAEWEDPDCRRHISWYISEFGKAGFEILPNLTYTPPHLGIKERTNSPPRHPVTYAIFVDQVCRELGQWFDYVELWNEWNLITDWDFGLDPKYTIFCETIGIAALAAKANNKQVVLGGMAGVRPQSLQMFRKLVRNGLMDYVDIVGFHSLRGTWSDKTPPPELSVLTDTLRREAGKKDPSSSAISKRQKLRERIISSIEKTDEDFCSSIHAELAEIDDHARFELSNQGSKQIWLTEYGFPSYDPGAKYDQKYLEEIQVALYANALLQANAAPMQKVYWYTLFDHVSPSVRKHITGWEDVLQYFYGIIRLDGSAKLLSELLRSGPESVITYVEENDLWHLVDAASLDRGIPVDYISQDRKVA